MSQWYLSYNGQQTAPLDHAAAVAMAHKNPNGHCWRPGFAEWIAIGRCSELAHASAQALAPEHQTFPGDLSVA